MQDDKGKKISKREFLKYSLLGLGGLAIGLNRFGAIANSISSSKLLKENVLPIDIWKWNKEAYYYTSMPNAVKCLLCPNQCIIKPNEKSICRNRVNFNDKLYSVAYGNPCSVYVDPIEKKPLLHFLPESKALSIAVAGCNFTCLNCQNWAISQTSPFDTKNFDLMPSAVIEQCAKNNCKSIAYTYTEPITFYEYMYDTSKMAREKGIKNVLVSNGYVNEKPLRALAKYLDAANIDLKSFKDEIYTKLNGGTLNPVLNTLKVLKEEGVWLEITNLIIPGWNDDFNMIKEMCDWLYENGLYNYPLHFSRFHPMYKLTQLPPTPVSTLEKAKDIAVEAGIRFVYIGNVPEQPDENTHCPKCKKMIVERKGYTVPTNYIQNNACKYCGEKIHGVWK